MIAIAVDDEKLMLGALVAAIKASSDISEVSQFSNCDEALDYVKENAIDIAFLDINMRGKYIYRHWRNKIHIHYIEMEMQLLSIHLRI